MNEAENTKLVQRAYETFKTGDIPTLLSLMSEDIEWQLPDMEGVPAGGTRRERAGAGEFFATIARDQEVQRFEPQQFVAQGDKVVALGQYAWRVKSTGREFKGDWAHVFTVRDGKIVKFQEYTDTAAAVAAYQPTRNG